MTRKRPRHVSYRPPSLSVQQHVLVFLLTLLSLLHQEAFYFAHANQDNNDNDDVVHTSRRHPLDDIHGPHHDTEEASSPTLSDVWLCLSCALLWTVWMVSACTRPPAARYKMEAQKVRGHVLQVRVDSDSTLMTGIPSYHAVVDYMVEQPPGVFKKQGVSQGNEDTMHSTYKPETLQVRKTFQTETLLEVGFANVELLVLPDDPTSGVLKADWERREQETINSTNNNSAAFVMDEHKFHARRWSLALGGLLAVISLVGAVKAVLGLADPLWGWISVAAAAVLMWPMAYLLYKVGLTCSKMVSQSPESEGVIVRGVVASEPKSSWWWCCGGGGGKALSSLYQATTSPTISIHDDQDEMPTTPRASNKSLKEECDKAHGNNKSAEETGGVSPGCYFVNLPRWRIGSKSKDDSIVSRERSEGSVSTLSYSVPGGVALEKGRGELDGLELPDLSDRSA